MGWSRGRGHGFSIPEAALAHRAAGCIHAARAVADGGFIAKAGAGHNSGRSLGSSRAIAVARTGGQIERSGLRDVRRLAVVRARGHTVRIAEAAGLDVLRSFGDGRLGRTAGRETVGVHQSARNRRRYRRQNLRFGSDLDLRRRRRVGRQGLGFDFGTRYLESLAGQGLRRWSVVGLDHRERSRVMIDRSRSGYERNGLVVMPGRNQYFRMQHSHPTQAHDQGGLRDHAKQELPPRWPFVG